MSITLQPWKLKLLSIPKSYPKSIESCTHAIVKNIFFPKSRDTLFSFTQNALELAIIADMNVITDEFLSLKLEGMMVTEDVFCAFMVDDPDGIDNSGRRINELSALLSRNGISIFYLSTRITDFILVKEKRIRSVLPAIRSLFSLSVDSDCDISSGYHSRGFSSESEQGSFPGSSFTSMNSFLHRPSSPSSSRFQSLHYQYPTQNGSYIASSFQNQQQQQQYGSSLGSSYSRPSPGITIPFGRRPNYAYYHHSSSRVGSGGFSGAPGRQNSDSDTSSLDGLNGTESGAGKGGKSSGGSGTIGNGYGVMSDSYSQSSFTHHHHNQQYSNREHQQRGRQNSIAESSFGEGIGRYFPKRHHHHGPSSYDSLDSIPNQATPNVGTRSVSANDNIMFPLLTPINNSFPSFGSFPSLGLMQETLEEQEEREAKIKEQIRKSCPRSVTDDKLIMAGLSLDYQSEWAVTLLKVFFYPEELPGLSSAPKSRFISFTTTDEGASLIAGQEVLSQFEDHMLNKSSSETMLRCIQVDLSRFGLDTFGLVYSMSNPLVDQDVNLLCMSTSRTANVLVYDSDLQKSLRILSMAG